MTVGDTIERNARLFPERTAFVCDGRKTTFRSFNTRVNKLANALVAAGLRRGERLALVLPTSLELLEVYGACEKLGLVAVPLNTRLSPREIAEILVDSEPAGLVYDARLAEIVPPHDRRVESIRWTACVCSGLSRPEDVLEYESIVQAGASRNPPAGVDSEDVVYMYYTSGTTGRPKGVLQTHRSALNNARRVLIDLEVRSDDVVVGSSPLYHIGGRSMTFNYFYRGCTVHILSKFDPDRYLELAERERATMLLTVPTTMKLLLDSSARKKVDLRSVRAMFYSGAPAAAPVLQAVSEWLGDVLQQVYGMSETGPAITVLRREDHAKAIAERNERRLLSCGRPCLDVDVRVVDESGRDCGPGEAGEVLVRSDSLMAGYWRLPELTAQALRDGWFFTGDVGSWDEEGYLYLVDRKKDMIVSGSENIYPREVENVLYQHPSIADVAVVGVPDERWGETVLAVVVPRPGKEISEAEIIDFCRGRLASYKKPNRVEFVSELPVNSIGKIDKKTLRERYWRGHVRMIN